MKHTLVGYTGFVGGNLMANHTFDALYNSKNIGESFGADNGLVVYSGMASEKYLANADPAADYAKARQALENMCRMQPEQLVLISTVDVYAKPQAVYEDSPARKEDMPAYGKNRLLLEGMVREEFPDALILRLPALYGKGLKKNFLYDMLTITPTMLTQYWFKELSGNALVAESYEPAKPGFYRVKELDASKKRELRAFFAGNAFNALSFTDSRSVFQFYSLFRLWADIERCLKAQLPLVNLAVAPLSAAQIYEEVFGKPFCNELDKPPAHYDMRTRFDGVLGGRDGYLEDAGQVIAGIKAFVAQWGK